jgi:hypothetical protein
VPPVDQRLAKLARISQENANLRILGAPRCPEYCRAGVLIADETVFVKKGTSFKK